MSHLVLLLVCILSVEVFIQFNFLSAIDAIAKVTKKVAYIIPNQNISDHWKEKVVPAYALKIMKFSLQILLILFLILSFFIFADYLLKGFLAFTLSFIVIMESMVFAFGYAYLRKVLNK